MSAEIHFRNYQYSAMQAQLPSHVNFLIDKTLELVDLIYWQPTVCDIKVLDTLAAMGSEEAMLVPIPMMQK
jgi:hypothetical protein